MIFVLTGLAAVFLAGVVCGVFATLVVGIRAEERRAMCDASSRPGAASRRLLCTRTETPARVKVGR